MTAGLLLPSRLGTCTRLSVRALDETERRDLIRHRAAARGIDLDDRVLDYLFTHQGRDLATLGTLLDRIYSAALAAQRRVTVPFLQHLLG